VRYLYIKRNVEKVLGARCTSVRVIYRKIRYLLRRIKEAQRSAVLALLGEALRSALLALLGETLRSAVLALLGEALRSAVLALLCEALRQKSEGHGLGSRWCQRNTHFIFIGFRNN
jgi:hypothetical protein